jgi:hypothetical protein
MTTSARTIDESLIRNGIIRVPRAIPYGGRTSRGFFAPAAMNDLRPIYYMA